MIVGAVGCDPKGGDSDTAQLSGGPGESTSDGTDGDSTTGGDNPGTSVGSGSASEPGDPSASDTATSGEIPGDPPSTTTEGTTSVGTTESSTSQGTDPTPADDPVPCEGEALELDAATLAYTYAQLPPWEPEPGDTGFGSGGDDPGIDPDTLYLRLSNKVATCSDLEGGLGCGAHWELSIRVPPAYQVPGIYHLAGPQVFGTVMETGPDEGGTCWGGGGTINGTLEIISVDDKEVKARLCHVDVDLLENVSNLDGSFSASRCQ